MLLEKLKRLHEVRAQKKVLEGEEKALREEILDKWEGPRFMTLNEDYVSELRTKTVYRVLSPRLFYNSLTEDEKERFLDIISVSKDKAKKLLGDRFYECDGVKEFEVDAIYFNKGKIGDYLKNDE